VRRPSRSPARQWWATGPSRWGRARSSAYRLGRGRGTRGRPRDHRRSWTQRPGLPRSATRSSWRLLKNFRPAAGNRQDDRSPVDRRQSAADHPPQAGRLPVGDRVIFAAPVSCSAIRKSDAARRSAPGVGKGQHGGLQRNGTEGRCGSKHMDKGPIEVTCAEAHAPNSRIAGAARAQPHHFR